MEAQYTPEQMAVASEHLHNALQEMKTALGALGQLDTDGGVPVNFKVELVTLWWEVWGQNNKLQGQLLGKILVTF